MGKKNPYVFTIGFDSTNPNHKKVADILNSKKSKATFIVEAVLCLLGEGGQVSNYDVAQDQLLHMIERVVQKELQKAIPNENIIKKEAEKVISLDEIEQRHPIDESMTSEVMKAIQSFRKG